MERVVRVSDLKGGVFLDLRDFVPVFGPEGHAWTWSLQVVPDLWADEGWDWNLEALESQITSDWRGLQFSFEDLARFADRVGQVIWGEFLAAESPSALPRRVDSASDVGRDAVAGLAATIDSTYWLLGGPAAIVRRATHQFETVDEVDPAEWIRGED